MKLKRRHTARAFVPTASMGDIAFLLIIFFMLTSNFVREKNIKQALPEAVEIELMKNLPVSVSVDVDGLVYVNGEDCQVEMLESLTASLLRDESEKRVMLKIDKDLTEEVFRPVFMALSRAGAEIALVGIKTN